MLIKGITDYSRACLLIALKNLFDSEPYYGQVEWGEAFLVDYFIDYERCTGFSNDNLYLLEECAPIKLLQYGSFTYWYGQADYFRLYDRNTNIRYRLSGNRNIVLVYQIEELSCHAICIPASEFSTYIQNYKFAALILPKHGLIVDHRTHEQDFPS